MRKLFFAIGLLASSPSVAADMSCAAVRAIFEPDKPNPTQVAAAMKIVTEVYTSLDDRNAKIGRPRIFERMSADGQDNTIAMATARCEQYPKIMLSKSATEVYRGIEDIGRTMGAYR